MTAAHERCQPSGDLVRHLRSYSGSPQVRPFSLIAICAEAADRIEALEDLGRFLLERLEEFDPGDDQPEREYHGHVAPALARFKAALAMYSQDRGTP